MPLSITMNFHELRVLTGFHSQMALARRAGLNVHTIRLIESGQRQPQNETVARLARAMGCRPNDVWQALARPTEESPDASK